MYKQISDCLDWDTVHECAKQCAKQYVRPISIFAVHLSKMKQWRLKTEARFAESWGWKQDAQRFLGRSKSMTREVDLIKENFATRLSSNDLESLPLKARLGQTLERPQYWKWYGQVRFCQFRHVLAHFGPWIALNSRILRTLRLGLPNWTLGTVGQILARQSKAWREFTLFSFFAAVPCQDTAILNSIAKATTEMAPSCKRKPALQDLPMCLGCVQNKESGERAAVAIDANNVRHQGRLKKCKMLHCIQMPWLLSI